MSHIWRSHTIEGMNHNPLSEPIIKEVVRNKNKGQTGWSKGLTKETDIRVAKMAKIKKEQVAQGKGTGCFSKAWYKTDAFKKHVDNTIRNIGGYQPRSGRGKHGTYQGYWCQSSWELAWVIYASEHQIKFQRCTEEFNYELDGKIKKYRPDFLLENGTYLEIKGYKDISWDAKKSQFPHQLTCYYKKEMKPILEYVIQRYGKDFIKLYEGV